MMVGDRGGYRGLRRVAGPTGIATDVAQNTMVLDAILGGPYGRRRCQVWILNQRFSDHYFLLVST